MKIRSTNAFAAVRLHLLLALAVAAATVGAAAAGPPHEDLASPRIGAWGIELGDRDPATRAGDDFFASQNGAWLARTELGAQMPIAGYWRDLRRRTPLRLNALMREVAADAKADPGSAQGRAGAFYRAFMDEATIERKGLAPLHDQLARIRAARTHAQIAGVMGAMAGPGTARSNLASAGPPSALDGSFSMAVRRDEKRLDRYSIHLGQGGLNLPAAYYSDPKLADIRNAYQEYVKRMLVLLDWSDPGGNAEKIVALETQIAAASWTPEQMQDAARTYHALDVKELIALAPDFDWRAFLAGAGVGSVDSLVIDADSAFAPIAALLARTPVEVLQARQAFALIDDAAAADCLDEAAYQAYFDFRIHRLRSALTVPPPRAARAYSALAANIGDILSSLYVARYFPASDKARVERIAQTLRAAFDARLSRTDWLSEPTRARARAKLARMQIGIGYPQKFRDYAGLRISDDDLYGDVMRSRAYEWQRQRDRIGKPFDRSEWTAAAEYANYNYNAATNSVEIPAGLLQPPFFDARADAAVNYGAAGSLIGAMIASGFGATGRHYDEDGRLQEWWTAEESRHFDALLERIAAQYAAVEPLPGMHVNGELLADESVADLSGLTIALDGYRLALKEHSAAPLLDGFTPEQRFFLGRAASWRSKFDPTFVRNQIATGVNAPPFLRVNGPVRNIDAWYAAFGVGAQDKLYLAPELRVRVW